MKRIHEKLSVSRESGDGNVQRLFTHNYDEIVTSFLLSVLTVLPPLNLSLLFNLRDRELWALSYACILQGKTMNE